MEWISLFRNLKLARRDHEMVLVGGHNARRAQFVERLLDLPLELYGKWGRRARGHSPLARHVKAKGIWGEALIRLYNSSKIVLNISTWDPALYPALNQHVFDVPATGAFLLTDYSPELEEHFRIGEEIGCYREVEELRDRARHYIAHDAERERVAAAGYRKALILPTILDRMRQVVARVEGR